MTVQKLLARWVSFLMLFCVFTTTVSGQTADSTSTSASEISSEAVAEPNSDLAPTTSISDPDTIRNVRLAELSRLIQNKLEQRETIVRQLREEPEKNVTKRNANLQSIDEQLNRLRATFELIALGDVNVELIEIPDDKPTDWRADLLEVLRPVVDSINSLTRRPRQLAELRDSIVRFETGKEVAQEALSAIDAINPSELDGHTGDSLTELKSKWLNELESFDRDLLVARSQLERLAGEQSSFVQGVGPAVKSFLLGRGLTLLIALVMAVLTWAAMRAMWWFYEKRFTTKVQRRTSTRYRLASYSFYLLNIVVVVLVVLCVLYLREDLLLLALAFLLIAGAVLSFRQFLPRYLKEARLLLNLGSVREDERVVYNGLPWQVMSLNIQSVLRNPELDGIIRLPLETIQTLISRPIKNRLWFPTSVGDYVILPDGVFGQIKYQTPDLVELNVKGGMGMTIPTPEFYSMSVMNLSREETFGVIVTFGFDYSLQAISLTVIPDTLRSACQAALDSAGYTKSLKSLLVEFSSAGSSSLDYLIFAQCDKSVASDYYKIERLLQQTCVAVANDKAWNIPFPQIMVHTPKLS